jgi:hypothetical protein
MEMRRLNIQFVDVATLLHELLAHIGYISELIVHGIGPMPTESEQTAKVFKTAFVENLDPLFVSNQTGLQVLHCNHTFPSIRL